MKLYKCAFTGKDAFTDAYKVTLENDLWYVVEGKYAKQSYGISDSLIGGNKSAEAEEDGEDGDETVLECNLITSAKLEEIPSICSKKDFKNYIKTYAQKLVKHVAEKDKERADFLKKELPNFVQTVLGDFDNCKFYATEDDAFDVNGVIIPFKQDCEFNTECDGTTCKILVLKDGLDEEAY